MHCIMQAALVAALLGPTAALAQNRLSPADTILTEPDQELDNFSGRFNCMHCITRKLRGVRAANKTVYRVSVDGR